MHTLAAVWATSVRKIRFSISVYEPGWLFMFVMYGFSKIQIVCVTLAAVGWWLKAISIHKSNFQIQLNKAGWLILFLVVSLIQIVCAALAAVCWCLRAINFAHFFIFALQFMRLAGCFRVSFVVFCMMQAVCAILAAVCWCLRATSARNISFPNIMCVAGWLFLFGICCCLCFKLSVSHWQLSAGA